eukprot:CAMPEP_0172451972 /NCGR_PEP_ID=MMETSP1065-20121228/9767_1 /TAXON_ID=265537 /ORGANISM="Amphiprora paludosa, Strain CCMP125" /LENGTH=232 /DNA_ID=CAMNT_0013203943 /DNA_START=62 /DNA_END=760 /DNA_ORIENTATION=-
MKNLPMALIICLLALEFLGVSAFQASPLMGQGHRPASALITRQNYAIAADPHTPSPQRVQFEERMRELVRKQQLQQEQQKQQQQQAVQNPKRSRAFGKRPAFLREASTVEEFQQLVGGETDRITVVRFYQPSCRSCKAATPLFDAVARRYPDSINWVEVPVTRQNIDLHQPLGLQTVPYGHIYAPGVGLVEEMKMGKPKMAEFARILESYAEEQVRLPEQVHPVTGIFQPSL